MWFRPAVEEALSLVPPRVRQLIEPRFLCGVSPRFVGFHEYDMSQTYPAIAAAGWTYDNCPHACFALGTPDEKPTVVLPRPDLCGDPVGVLLHEYGHLFDEATRFHLDVPETTAYSRTNRMEAVAEAFQLVLKPESALWDDYMHCEAMRPLRDEMGVA
jgi:hypothetical protein